LIQSRAQAAAGGGAGGAAARQRQGGGSVALGELTDEGEAVGDGY
jgi:hypothetical protein